MPMKDDVRNIYRLFNGKLVGSQDMKLKVCEVLALMPREIVNYITSNCWFMASLPDAYAFTFTGNDLWDQHLIFLSDELLDQEKESIYYTIAHEIGHVI